MNTYLVTKRQVRISVLGVLLILLSGSAGLFAQPATLPQSTAQVIAQGVDELPGEDMRWDVQEVVLPSEAGPGFVYVSAGQVQIGNDGIGDQLISQDQAGYVYWGDPQPLVAFGDTEVTAQSIGLVQSSPDDPDAVTPPFSVEPGRYNLQLTRGILTGEQVDTFSPVNELEYLVIVTAGTVNIEVPGADPGDGLAEGAFDQLTGEITLTAADGVPATYLIASIGEAMDPVETTAKPAANGSAMVYFWDCGTESMAVARVDQCAPIAKPLSASFTRFSDGMPLTRTDGVIADDGAWIVDNLFPGEWEFQLMTEDGSTPPAISIIGDAAESDGYWLVQIRAGETTTLNVMTYQGAVGTDYGTLTVTFMECPQGWSLEMGFSDCSMAPDAPNLVMLDLNQQSTLIVQEAALETEPGVFVIDPLAVGTYQLTLDYFGSWHNGNTILLHDAVWAGEAYQLDVLANVPHSVMVVRVVEDEVPVTLTGYVVLTQETCEGTGDDIWCEPVADAWNVTFMSRATGEEYSLLEIGYEFQPGYWSVELPVGEYILSVPDPGDITVEVTGWVLIEVGTETPAVLRIYP